MSGFKLLMWFFIIILAVFVFMKIVTYDPEDDFEKKYTCSSIIALFNITQEERNCNLVNCTKLNDEPYVDVCDCGVTNTKIFRQCDVQMEVRNYIGDADKLRGDILTKHPEYIADINVSVNPGINLVYSDGSTEAY